MTATAPNDLLVVRDLIVGYGVIQVLQEISLSVGPGEAVALVGANGAGKTTTLKSIIGALPITSGEVRLGDQSLNGLNSPRIASAGVAIVPEGREVFPSLTVEENLVIGAWTNQSGDRESFYQDAYDLFPRLWERRNQNAGTLSGGEQQMLAVARALVSDPRVLLIDEPSMGLAPMVVADVYDALRHINQAGTAILLVEQNISLALDICSRGYVMERGAIVLEGSCDDLLDDKRVIEAYLGLFED